MPSTSTSLCVLFSFARRSVWMSCAWCNKHLILVFWVARLFFFFFFFHAENVCVCSMRHWGDIRTSLVIQKRFSRLFSGLVSVLDEDGKTLSVCVRALLDSLHRPQTLVVNCYTLALHDRNWRWPVHFTDETSWQILQGRVRLSTALVAVYGNLCSFVIRHVLSFLCSGYIAFLLFFFSSPYYRYTSHHKT